MLVQSLPQNFTENVGHLEQYLTATAIYSIVSSADADQGNRMIMDCLMKQLTHQEDLLELCERLEKIPDAPALTNAIEELRKGLKHNIEVYIQYIRCKFLRGNFVLCIISKITHCYILCGWVFLRV